jgi:hypothetical protein
VPGGAVSSLMPIAVGQPVARLPPQIPACGITAPGSSDTLACASPAAIAASEVGTVARPCMSGGVSCRGYVCLSAPSPRARLARLRVLWADLTPHAFAASLLVLSRPPAWLPRNAWGLPSSQRFSAPMPRSLWTPADPRRTHHTVCSVLASAAVNALPSASSTLTRLYQDFGVCVTPAA